MTICSTNSAWIFELYNNGYIKQNSSLLELGPQDLAINMETLENQCKRNGLNKEFNELTNSLKYVPKARERNSILKLIRKIYFSGYTPPVLSIFLRNMYEKYFYKKNVATKEVETKGNNSDKDCENASLEPTRKYYSLFGITEYYSLDLFDQRSEFHNDLNNIFDLKNKFDLITNFGTAEHCFNIGNAFTNIHNHLKLNGICLMTLPVFGQVTHCFYNINPYFYIDLCKANKYELLSFHYMDDHYVHNVRYDEQPHMEFDFKKLRITLDDILKLSQNELDIKIQDNFYKNYTNRINRIYRDRYPAISDYCFVAFKKTHSEEIVVPIQSHLDPNHSNVRK